RGTAGEPARRSRTGVHPMAARICQDTARMTATVSPSDTQEPMPLADYLGGVLRRLRALPALDLDLTQAHGNVLAEDVVAPHPFPAFDQAAIDGYACRSEDIAHATLDRPARLSVVGDLAASSWRPAR